MLTTDFTGTYDYELEEAKHAASGIHEDFCDEYYDSMDDVHEAILKERIHWKNQLSEESFNEFNNYFTAELKKLNPLYIGDD